MIISPEKIRIIREIIRKRYNAFIVKMGGPELLSDAELKELIAEGLITPEEEGLLKEAYFIGRVRNDPVVKPSERDSITLEEFRRKYKTFGFPITDVEKFALEGIGSNISNYISNLSDKTRGAVESVINQANMDYRNELLGEEGINALTFGMAEHKTINQIAADLRDKTGDFFRDWKRVAITETTNAMNLGEADAIVKRNKGVKPEDIYCFKFTSPDDALCKFCKKAYLMEDEVTPRVFKLSDLKANGSNYGLKTSDWVPTLGSLHPNCRCSLSEIPQGFGFKEGSSTLTYKGPDFKYKNPQE